MTDVLVFLKWCGVSIAGIIAVYAVVRLVAAAYFMSRYDYERRKEHGQKQPR